MPLTWYERTFCNDFAALASRAVGDCDDDVDVDADLPQAASQMKATATAATRMYRRVSVNWD
jgi:hypothetical protein